MLKAGIIGLGVGEQHIEGFERDKLALVTHLCDFDEEKIQYLKDKYPDKVVIEDPSELIENKNLDVISIASFDNFHYEQIIKCIVNGKHIFVEKPMCLTKEQLDDIKLKLPEDLLIASNLILRQTPRFKTLKQKVDNSELGDIYYIEASYDYGRVHKLTRGWRGKLKQYSVMLGGGIHLLDLVLWITKSKIKEVVSLSSDIFSKDLEMENSDFFASLVRLDNGVILKLVSNYASATPHLHQFKVYGTKGSFFHDLNEAYYFQGRDTDCIITQCGHKFPGVAKGDFIPNFIRSILGKEQLLMPKEELFDLMYNSFLIEDNLKNDGK